VIVAFSTSSPLASVAVISRQGVVLGSSEELAPMRASGACLSLLSALLFSLNLKLSDADIFVSDLGPGSFTGVKVGVTLAKTLAFANGKLAAGTSSFDLIDPSGIVVLPSKKGEWFIRRVGEEAFRSTSLPDDPFSGYGVGIEPMTYPRAERFAGMVLEAVAPENLVPSYLMEPSISVPKKAYSLQKD
jgi:tRNA threonylcarbamoyladenosine biosynthesis protein TsaB